MANICEFSMCAKGASNSIKKFYNALKQEGDIWMGRGADASITNEEYIKEEGLTRVIIDGWCKWSIQSALIDNAVSMRTHPDRWCGIDSAKEFITLREACERYNIIMEVFSKEPGCGFQEHYIYNKGEVLVDDCVDYYECFLEYFSSREEFENETGICISNEEWEIEDYISSGGFEWDFEI